MGNEHGQPPCLSLPRRRRRRRFHCRGRPNQNNNGRAARGCHRPIRRSRPMKCHSARERNPARWVQSSEHCRGSGGEFINKVIKSWGNNLIDFQSRSSARIQTPTARRNPINLVHFRSFSFRVAIAGDSFEFCIASLLAKF